METVHHYPEGFKESEGSNSVDVFDPDAIIKALTQRLDSIRHHAIPEKHDKILQLERSMLDFYYQRAIYNEQLSEDASPYTIPQGDDACRELKIHRNIEQMAAPATASVMPAYYETSEWAKLWRQKRSLRKAFDKEYSVELSKVQELEKSVEREIVQGSFAAKRVALIEEEKSLKELEEALQQKKDWSKRFQHQIHREEEIQLELRKEQSEWEEKKRRLEESKQSQQNNVDGIRQGLQAAQDKLTGTKLQFRQREMNIQYLKKLIADRIVQNKRQEQLKKASINIKQSEA